MKGGCWICAGVHVSTNLPYTGKQKFVRVSLFIARIFTAPVPKGRWDASMIMFLADALSSSGRAESPLYSGLTLHAMRRFPEH